MRSQDSEQQILNAMETQLRSDDPDLTASFMAFTSLTRNTGMPPAELSGIARWVACRPVRRYGIRMPYALLIQLVMLFFAGMTIFFILSNGG